MIDTGLQGKVVLVTGANNPYGIGAATAKAFAAEGAAVMLHYFRWRREPPPGERADQPGLAFYLEQQAKTADDVVRAIRDAGGIADSWEGDLADPRTIPRLFDAAQETLAPVDVLVNNAAFDLPDTFVPEDMLTDRDRVGEGEAPLTITAELHDQHFAVNSRAAALMMTEFARRQVSRGAAWGRIINVSTDGAPGFRGEVSYGASKNALESYSRAAAAELARFGITVNIASPGPIQTGYITPELEEKLLPEIPLGRLGQSGDVAEVIVFLASNQARWLTGQTLYVGGGHEMPI